MNHDRRNVLVTVPFFDEETRLLLESSGCSVSATGEPDGNTTHDELVELLKDKQAWIVGHAQVTRQLLEASPTVEVIARRGVGFDRVDTAAAEELGRIVTIASGGNAPSVADHTVGLMIASGRRFYESQTRAALNDWAILVGTELYRKTVGLIGFGRIARQVARRLDGFDVSVIAYDPTCDPKDAEAHGIRLVGFETLLRESDYVSLHVPLTEKTANVVDAAAMEKMKPTAILINTSRGGLVDEEALLNALRHKRLRAAALDVFEFESTPSKKEIVEALLRLPNFVATPHAAGSTEEALIRSNRLAAQSIISVFDGVAPVADCVVVDGRQRQKA